MKIPILITAILFASSCLFAATLDVSVKTGTAGAVVPADIAVQLNRYVNGKQDTDFSAKVDTRRNGNFIFENLSSNDGASYEPMVIYKGVRYYGNPVQFQKDARLASQVTIYEPITSDSAISVLMHHYLIQPAEGFTTIQEVMVMENKSDRTFVGQERTASGKLRTLSFRLPDGAKDVQLGKGMMSCCIEFIDNGFYDTMEFIPGRKQMTFSYRLDSGKELNISKPISLATAEFDIMSTNPAVLVSGDNIKEIPVQNQSFKRYVAAHLKPGDTMSMKIAGLPGKPVNLATWSLLLFALIATALVAYFYKRAKKRETRPATLQQFSEQKDKLIHEIAGLDEAFEQGSIEKQDYQQKRKMLKEQIERLLM